MKRDLELVKLILLNEETGNADLSAYDDKQICHHVAIMVEAGLLLADCARGEKGDYVLCGIDRLTWKGHDFLDAARNDSIWRKARIILAQKGLVVPFDLFKEFLMTLLKEQLLP